MSDTSIPSLAAIAPVTGDSFPLVRAASSVLDRRATIDAIKTYVLAGALVSDTRKCAAFLAGTPGIKKVGWSGDSTTLQLESSGLVTAAGIKGGQIGTWFPELQNVTHYNRGRNGGFFKDFVAVGSGGANSSEPPVNTNLDDLIALACDAYVIDWGKNDLRGEDLSAFGDFTTDASYGSTGQKAAALVIQGYMRTAVTRIRAALPNAVIIFREPSAVVAGNTTNGGSPYVLAPSTGAAIMNVLRLAYHGDASLSVPSPESFSTGVLVFKTCGVVYGYTPPVTTPLLVVSSDGFHETPVAYNQIVWGISYLLAGAGTPADSLASAAAARTAAAIERSASHGWDAVDIPTVMDGSDWKPVYSIQVANLGGSSYIDMYVGPISGSASHAFNGLNGPPGLALGDIVVWGGGGSSPYMLPVALLPDAINGYLRWYNGHDLHNRALPQSFAVGDQGVIYRNKYANTLSARRNARELVAAEPQRRQLAFPYSYLFTVIAANSGSMVLAGISGELGASAHNASNHTMTTGDVLCMTGIEAGAIEQAFGLILTGATFSVSGNNVTITLAGTDFSKHLGAQGVLLSAS